MSEERFIDFESRIAFQEHRLQELTELVAVQQKQLYDLEQFSQLLLKKVTSTSGLSAPAAVGADEKPPHY